MNEKEFTLANLLKADKKSSSISQQIRSALGRHREKIKIGIPVPWDQLLEQIVEKIPRLLDLKLLDLCLAGWKQHRELQQFTDQTKHPPAEVNEVPLLEHEIVSQHHPALEIRLSGVRAKRIEFDLDVSLKLQGFVLTIQGGKIKRIRLGTYRGEASLQWEGIALLKAESEAMPLGGAADLAEGVPISRA